MLDMGQLVEIGGWRIFIPGMNYDVDMRNGCEIDEITSWQAFSFVHA
jgi:hypothetical protein